VKVSLATAKVEVVEVKGEGEHKVFRGVARWLLHAMNV